MSKILGKDDSITELVLMTCSQGDRFSSEQRILNSYAQYAEGGSHRENKEFQFLKIIIQKNCKVVR